MTEVPEKKPLSFSSVYVEDTSRARKCIENWQDLLYALSKMNMCKTLLEPHIDIQKYVREVEEIGRATIDQLEIVLTTESVKGVSKEHQDAIIDEAEKTYRLANTHKLGSVLSQYHVREMSFAHYFYRLRQGDAALLEIWELLNWHHEGWERKQKRCLVRHLTATLKASPVSSFGGGTSQSVDTSGGIYERYACGREYASRAIGALVYARSVTAVNDISKSSRSFTTIATHAYELTMHQA
ncbi:uncharacterized protein STEHIDRAFT_155266 [Stereum hirsutum FP-91666 SS1]|uniref:uncharacterized protein n=1 Tax=Stereum hirsutum (strain FP-91666) TaxID=721885 RepID=UPI000440EC43|nr:uncharacterized protein STEHIDRAFT_155266 [Stereum hirsutum FP-91666 SS1]EIM87906.1 hypothetical protein STEHIDRAFT_155266 [Stereum hirsutum FP-91666 SS1]